MAFVTRQYSKGAIDRAGEQLISMDKYALSALDTWEVINNWRSCHSYPLQAIKMTLLKRAKKFDPEVLVAQRLKRLQSIVLKLKHNENMALSQMQDIGGCRAVLKDQATVDRLVDAYEKTWSKNPNARPVGVNRHDYIANPKPDGYRSVHLIYKYQSDAPDKTPYNGQRIEIQIRSALQHAWATAVEVCQTFTGQALKTKLKRGSQSWLRFFALMGSAIALREGKPLVPNTPENPKELLEELRALVKSEDVIHQFQSWHAVLAKPPASGIVAHTYLLILDSQERKLLLTAFEKSELKMAQETYIATERATEHEPHKQVVLVAVDSLSALQKAYPNYYLDTAAFVTAIEDAIA